MKVMKKLLALLLLIVMAFPMTACGNKDTEGVLIINVYQGGYGIDWVYDLADKFQAETGIETHVEKYIGKMGVQNIRTDLTSEVSVADLIISKDMMFDEIYKGERNIKGVKYDNIFEDLTELYKTKIPGEEVTIEEKMDKNYRDFYNIDGKYYTTPWASGMIGILYNKNIWNEAWEIPNTTDEMFALCDTIKAAASKEGFQAPFIYSEDDEYWSMFSHVWVAQYMGSEGMKKFYDGYNADGLRYEPDLFEDDSFYSTLSILERLLKNENKYMHPSSQDVSFDQMQGSFLQGKAVMTPNGDWIEREMKGTYKDVNIEFMKTPVNSALANKCSFKSESNKDEILSAAIDYVDANKEGYANLPEKVTEGDIDIIRDARSIEYTVGPAHFMAIPSYSNAKEEAKKFIQYMASDKGIKSYVEKTTGCVLPYEYDYSSISGNFSDFRKSTSKLINSSNMLFSSNKNKLFSVGGVNMYWNNDKAQGRVIPALSATNKDDFMSATQIEEINFNYLKANWKSFMNNAFGKGTK